MLIKYIIFSTCSFFLYFHLNFALACDEVDREMGLCDTDGESPLKGDPCKGAKAKIENYQHLLDSCQNSCDATSDPQLIKFNKCTRKACTNNCNQQIADQIHGCEEVIRNLQNTCTQCNTNPFHIPDADIGQNRQVCADESRKAIARELERGCSDNYPDGLICPGGDSRENHNCQQICQNEAAKTVNNISSQCGDITTVEGFNCLNSGAAQTQASSSLLPRNPNQLPKGFRWENCALGMSCDHKIKNVFDTALQECKGFKQKALLCCGKDLSKCETSGSNSGTGGAELFKNAGSITASCQKIKEASDNMNNIVQKINNQCQSDSASCVQSCSTKIVNQVQPLFLNTCNFDLDNDKSYKHGEHRCSEGLINKYTDYYANKLFPILSECSSLGTNSYEQTQAATEKLFKTSLSSANCAEQASGGVVTSDSKPEQPTSVSTPTAMDDVWKQTGGSVPSSANNTNKSSSLYWNANKKSWERLIKNTSGEGGSSASKKGQASRSPSATPGSSEKNTKTSSNNKKMSQNNKNDTPPYPSG